MQHTAKHLTAQMQECIDACIDAHGMCEETITYCLQQGGRHADAMMIRAMTDCAEMTRMCADMMMRNSDFAMTMCRMCADVCMRCAEACARMDDDQQMSSCADMCRRTTDMCRTMAAASA